MCVTHAPYFKMKLSGWQKRLDEHHAKIDRLEASGEMTDIHKYDPKKFAKLYKRLGYLKQKVASLSKRAVWTEIEEGAWEHYTQTGFNRGDHIIFRGFSGEDIYGTITGISDMDNHFRVEGDNGHGYHVKPVSMVHAD